MSTSSKEGKSDPTTMTCNCATCGAQKTEYACSECKTRFYCGEKCQWNDWGKHRASCVPPPLPVQATVNRFKFWTEREDRMGTDVNEKEYLETLSDFASSSAQNKKKRDNPRFATIPEDRFVLDPMEPSEFAAIAGANVRKRIKLNQSKSLFIIKKENAKREWSDRDGSYAEEEMKDTKFQILVRVVFLEGSDLKPGEMKYAITKDGNTSSLDYTKDVEELKDLLKRMRSPGGRFKDKMESRICWTFFFALGPSDFDILSRVLVGNNDETSEMQMENDIVNIKSYYYELVSIIINQDLSGAALVEGGVPGGNASPMPNPGEVM